MSLFQLSSGALRELLVLRAPTKVPDWFEPKFAWKELDPPPDFIIRNNDLWDQWKDLDRMKFEANQNNYNTQVWSEYWKARESELLPYRVAVFAQWPWFWADSIVKAENSGKA
jgi:hypothetical protein